MKLMPRSIDMLTLIVKRAHQPWPTYKVVRYVPISGGQALDLETVWDGMPMFTRITMGMVKETWMCGMHIFGFCGKDLVDDKLAKQWAAAMANPSYIPSGLWNNKVEVTNDEAVEHLITHRTPNEGPIIVDVSTMGRDLCEVCMRRYKRNYNDKTNPANPWQKRGKL